MGYEETNPQDIPTEKVHILLKTIFPDIKETDVHFFYHGTYNVFIVYERYIFRFPDKALYNKEGFELVTKEKRFLDEIKDKISFRIPEPLFISKDPKNPFVGYERIPGISLSRIFEQLTDEDKISIGKQIGKISTEYHSKELFEEVAMKLYETTHFPTSEHKKAWEENYAKTRKIVFPIIEQDERIWLETLFSQFLETGKNFHYTPTLTHGDFDTSNILVDAETKKVTGIIDFEDARVADPAYDLIFRGEGEIFRNAILENYGGVKDESMQNRTRFYYCRAGAIYIQTGIELKYPRMVEYGKELLQKRMKEFPLESLVG